MHRATRWHGAALHRAGNAARAANPPRATGAARESRATRAAAPRRARAAAGTARAAASRIIRRHAVGVVARATAHVERAVNDAPARLAADRRVRGEILRR